jgi:hypothetical protein
MHFRVIHEKNAKLHFTSMDWSALFTCLACRDYAWSLSNAVTGLGLVRGLII